MSTARQRRGKAKRRGAKISAREAERRFVQSMYSPRKISEAEADRWLENQLAEREARTTEVSVPEDDDTSRLLRTVAWLFVVWSIGGILLSVWAFSR